MRNSRICILGSILKDMYVYVVYEANQTIEALMFLNQWEPILSS